MKKLKIIISGGGTGGHIFPAIAIANELKIQLPDCDILFVGAKNKMEMQKVPLAGYKIEGLWIAGIQRKISLQNLLFPLKLISSLFKAYTIIRKFKPDIAIGTGGFASGPLLQMANKMGVKTLIQEQNSYPGITNKILAKKASKICVAYDGLEKYFPENKIVKTGNPIRQDILNIASFRNEGIETFNLDASKKTVLVLGGSLGARRINELIFTEKEFILSKNIQILWQCGKLYENEYAQYNNVKNITVTPFLENMNLAYATADFIISRAGASSVSELAILGKPVIFIPSPNVAEDHQTKNANAIVTIKGALMIKEKDLEKEFKTVFESLVTNETLQNELSRNIKTIAKPNATKDIVEQIKMLIR